MAKRKTNSATTPDPYKEFLKTLKFDGLGLDSSVAHLDRPALSNLDPTQPEPVTYFDAKYRIVARDPDRFVVETEFVLTRKRQETDEKPILTITASYTALFMSDQKPSDALLERFAGGEARLIFWPYIRYFIADISARMSIDQLLLPLTSQFEDQVRNKK